MDALPIVLMVCGPVIVIGTALYVWRERAPTPSLRRRRGLKVAIGLMLAFLATGQCIEGDLTNLGQLWFEFIVWFLVLAHLVLKLRRAGSTHG